jgi:hypothetical protein
MVSRLDSQLIPTRFLLTMAHFIAVLMVFYTKQNNIANSLASDYTQGDYNQATSSVLAAVWLSILCLALEFLGMLSGVSLFMRSLSGFAILSHFTGGILICWYIVEAWHFVTIWYLWAFFCVPTAALEAIAFIRIFCCRVVAY